MTSTNECTTDKCNSTECASECSGAHLICDASHSLWGTLPTPETSPACTIEPGMHITIDTLSHEGLLEDQGRDPLRFFTAQGVAPCDVPAEAMDVADNGVHVHGAGPHIITRPIEVRGAAAGDWLRIDIDRLTPRVPYGVISNRHGRGVLPGLMPRGGRAVTSIFARQIVDATHGGEPALMGIMERKGPDAVSNLAGTAPHAPLYDIARDGVLRCDERLPENVAGFELHPFLGIMGVTPLPGAEVRSTIPPGDFGGNIDIKLLTEGTTLYLPVQVDGAGFYVGDPHFAQGDGEVALTAMEASLTAKLTVSVVGGEEFRATFGNLHGPFIVTNHNIVTTGRADSIDGALQECVRESLCCLERYARMDAEHAYAFLSAAADFSISEAVDIVMGVHCRMPRSVACAAATEM